MSERVALRIAQDRVTLCRFDVVVVGRIEIANVVIVKAEAGGLPFGVDSETLEYLRRAERRELADALASVKRPPALRVIPF